MRLARVAALLTILISLPGIGHGQAPGEPRTCTLGGKVLYAPHLKAAARIPVRVEDIGSGVTVQQALTDSAGSFYFDGLTRDSFEVLIEVEGFQPHREGVEFSLVCFYQLTIVLQPKNEVVVVAPGNTLSVSVAQIPSKARKAFGKGLRELNQKRPEHSLRHFREAIQQHPSFDEAYVQLGAAHTYLGQYAEAVSVLLKATTVNPGNARAYGMLGIVYRQRAETQRSIEALEEAVRLDENAWHARVELAKSLVQAGRTEEALAQAEQAHRLDPQVPTVHLLLHDLHVLRQDYQAALAEVEEFLELFPQSPMAAQARQERDKLRRTLGSPP